MIFGRLDGSPRAAPGGSASVVNSGVALTFDVKYFCR